MLIASRRRPALNIWPGFVDALAALLMVVIFVLLLFSLGQFLLNDALVGRDEALSRLRGQMNNLSTLLAQTRAEKLQLEQRLQGVESDLQSTRTTRDELQAQLAALTLKAEEGELALAALQAELNTSREEISRAESEADDLNQRLTTLNDQIARLNSALEVSESSLKEKTLEVEDLGVRLNEAMVDKVEELAAYRSEFFGKLHEALKDNPDVRIEGDRFLLPSEVLFPSASASLDARGQREIAKVARTLKEIMAKIPPSMDWVLRVDGHTDRRPIRVAFPSNWELSSARATSIVKDLISEGIPPEHLVAAGFAQYHPVDTGDTAEAYKANRRIELKLTSR